MEDRATRARDVELERAKRRKEKADKEKVEEEEEAKATAKKAGTVLAIVWTTCTAIFLRNANLYSHVSAEHLALRRNMITFVARVPQA